MNRTFNAYVDNGLYVSGHYLDKQVNDITIEDLKENTLLFAEKVFDFISCDKYSKLASMGFHNSCYTQAVSEELVEQYQEDAKKMNIKKSFDLMLSNIGADEVCSICGQRHVNTNADKNYISMLSRSVFPLTHGNTFMNYTNNLRFVNICPICCFMAMVGILNMRKTGDTLTVFISEDENFMINHTEKLQEQNNSDIVFKAQFNKKEEVKYIKHISNVIEEHIINGIMYDGYLQAVSFYNGGQAQKYVENFLDKKKLNLMKELMAQELLSEFKLSGLMKPLIENRLRYVYLKYLVDSEKEELKCSKELFDAVDKEVWAIDTKTLELIKDVCNKVKQVDSVRNEIEQLKLCGDIRQFEKILNEWTEKYKSETEDNLFNQIEDYDRLCDIRKFKSIKQRMICQLLIG